MRTLSLGVSRNHAGATVDAWPEILCQGVAAGLGSAVKPALYEDYDHLLGAVLDGSADVAWLPPLLHARAAAQGVRLLALPQRGGWLTFRSALLVRKDSPARSLQDLRGARMAWRDRASASGYLFPRLELARRGGLPLAAEKFYGSLVEAAQAVLSGEADACTCYVTDAAAHDADRAAAEIEKALGAMARELRAVHVTDPIPPDGFVVGARVGEQERAAIGAALLGLHTTVEGKKALEQVLHAERLAPVTDALLRSLQSWAEAATARA